MKHTNASAERVIRAGDLSGDFSAVTRLDVWDCPGLTALPDLPAVTTLFVLGCSGLTALHSDNRGYRLYRASNGSWHAGCRNFRTADAALAHWGAPDYPNRERGDEFCAAIRAEEARTAAKETMQ